MSTPQRFTARRLALAAMIGLSFATANVAALTITTEDYPPFNMNKEGSKEIVGIATDIVRKIMDATKTQYTIELLPWQRAYNMAQEKADVCVYSTTRTEQREPLFKWVGPLVSNDWTLFAKADSNIQISKLEDAKKYKIGGYKGDAVEQYLISEKFNVDSTNSDNQNVPKLAAGRIDLWATGNSLGPYLAGKENVKVKPVFKIRETQMYLACNKAVPDATIKALNDALTALRKDGTVDKIHKNYQ